MTRAGAAAGIGGGGARRRLPFAAAALAAAWLALAGGCATGPQGEFGSAARRLQRVGESRKKTPGRPTAEGERELMRSFWASAGVETRDAELDAVLPVWAGGTGGGEGAMKRMAARHGRVLGEVRADRDGLRNALDEGVCLLIVVPSGGGPGGGARLGIPVAWADGWVEVRLGGGGIRRWKEDDFFARRERTDQRALLLFDPGEGRPGQRGLALALGDHFLGNGDFRRAEAVFREELAGDSDGDARAGAGLGDALCRWGQFAEAVPVYESARALEPGNPRLANNLAFALLKVGGRLDEAEKLATFACEKRPRNPMYLETAAEVRLAQGQPEAAAKLLERAWGLARNLPDDARREIMDQLTRAWLAADRQSLAWQVWSARMREFPDAPVPDALRKALPPLDNGTNPPASLSR